MYNITYQHTSFHFSDTQGNSYTCMNRLYLYSFEYNHAALNTR